MMYQTIPKLNHLESTYYNINNVNTLMVWCGICFAVIFCLSILLDVILYHKDKTCEVFDCACITLMICIFSFLVLFSVCDYNYSKSYSVDNQIRIDKQLILNKQILPYRIKQRNSAFNLLKQSNNVYAGIKDYNRYTTLKKAVSSEQHFDKSHHYHWIHKSYWKTV